MVNGECVVATTLGLVRGHAMDDVDRFLGIPYARAARFCPPVPVERWDGVIDATSFGPACPQMPTSRPDASGRRQRLLEAFGFRPFEPIQSEQCLVLNLWRPTNAKRCPVLFWIHGGIATGSAGSSWSDGENLARECGVIVVAPNYRMSVLGHLYLEGLVSGAPPETGNYGLADLEAGLTWVSENVGALGGDSTNVTVGGVSLGATRAACVLATGRFDRMITRAILHSPIDAAPLQPDEARARSARLLGSLGLPHPTLRDLQQINLQPLLTAAEHLPPLLPVAPTSLLPKDPIAAFSDGAAAGLPIILGTTRDEGFRFVGRMASRSEPVDAVRARCRRAFGDLGGRLFDAYREAYPGDSPRDTAVRFIGGALFVRSMLRFARSRAGPRQRRSSTYLFRFGGVMPLGDVLPRSPHGFDVPFAFRNLSRFRMAERVPGNRDIEIEMSARWSSFACAGEVAPPGSIDWPTFDVRDAHEMAFDPSGVVVDDVGIRTEMAIFDDVPAAVNRSLEDLLQRAAL